MNRILRHGLWIAFVFCWSISAHAETPRNVSFELKTGPVLSEIDNEFTNSGLTPYDDMFNSDMMWAYGGYLDYQFYQGVGSLALGVGIQYGSVSGFAQRADGSTTEESTTMHLMPPSLGLTYRFDYLAQKFKIPLVPYVKMGITCAIWWVTNDKGEVANTYAGNGEEALGWSNTFGFYGGGGIQFLLDGLSPRMAASMDSEVGVNNSYLFVEYLRHELNDFYSDTSINLSGHGISFGLIFEF